MRLYIGLLPCCTANQGERQQILQQGSHAVTLNNNAVKFRREAGAHNYLFELPQQLLQLASQLQATAQPDC